MSLFLMCLCATQLNGLVEDHSLLKTTIRAQSDEMCKQVGPNSFCTMVLIPFVISSCFLFKKKLSLLSQRQLELLASFENYATLSDLSVSCFWSWGL